MVIEFSKLPEMVLRKNMTKLLKVTLQTENRKCMVSPMGRDGDFETKESELSF